MKRLMSGAAQMGQLRYDVYDAPALGQMRQHLTRHQQPAADVDGKHQINMGDGQAGQR